MKTLMLLRHGKSPHPEGVDDFARPLSRTAAVHTGDMARALAGEGLLPAAVLASSARRATETAEALCEAANCPPPTLLDELYLAPPSAILEAVARLGEDSERLVVVGHNPGMEDTCERLIGGPLPTGKMRTGAMAIFSVASREWSALAPRDVTLVRVVESR
jgi:phosphohistidine phosphatase